MFNNFQQLYFSTEKNNADIKCVENTLFFLFFLTTTFDKFGFICLLSLVKIQIKKKTVSVNIFLFYFLTIFIVKKCYVTKKKVPHFFV